MAQRRSNRDQAGRAYAHAWEHAIGETLSGRPAQPHWSVFVRHVGCNPRVTRIDRTFDATANGYEVGAAVGVDADIAIGSHLSAVPQIRVIGIPNGGVSIRPGVGLRATW